MTTNIRSRAHDANRLEDCRIKRTINTHQIAALLDRIGREYGGEHGKVTVICRTPDQPSWDLLMGNDSLPEIKALLERSEARAEVDIMGKPVTKAGA